MDEFGALELRRRVWVPGTDNAEQITEIEAEIESIAALIGTPAWRGVAAEKMSSRLAGLNDKLDTLKSEPVVPAGYRFEGTGQTVAQAWESWDSTERNAWLRRAKVRCEWTRQGWHYDFTELESTLAAIDPEQTLEQFLARQEEQTAAARKAVGMDDPE